MVLFAYLYRGKRLLSPQFATNILLKKVTFSSILCIFVCRIMDVTLDYIAQRYQHFNELCFAGQLSLPPMRLSRARRALGQITYRKRRRLFGGYEYSNITFVISALAARDMTAEEVDDIILHEMIHYYILSNQMQDTSAHGRLFRQEMQRINNAIGSHITITHRDNNCNEDERLSENVRQNYVAVLRLQDNTWGVIVAARTRLFQFQKQLQCFPQVQEVHWYSTTNPYFNRFPRHTTLKYHPLSASEIRAQLNDANACTFLDKIY